MHELLHVENSYVQGLTILCETFKKPLVEQKLLSPVEADSIFLTADGLLESHQKVQKTIKLRQKGWGFTQVLGDVFSDEIFDEIKPKYQEYINQYESAQTALKEIMAMRPALRKEVQEIEMGPICNGCDFSSYLILPVQRIPRYIMLFKELDKFTFNEHRDKVGIRHTLSKLMGLATFVNESRRLSMSQQKIMEVALSVEGVGAYVDSTSSMVNSKKYVRYNDWEFVMEGPLHRQHVHSIRSTPFPVYIFLFHNFLLCAKSVNDNSKAVKGIFGLRKYKYSLMRGISLDRVKGVTPDGGLGFFISMREGDKKYHFLADKETTRDMWISHLTTILGTPRS